MSNHLETEFKNILSPAEYQSVFDRTNFQNQKPALQDNSYFDTEDQKLANQGAALRVRQTPSYCHLTLKEQYGDSGTQHMETTDDLSRDELVGFQQNGTFEHLKGAVSTRLAELGISSRDLKQTGHFHTRRFEKRLDDYLIVLDAVDFPNFSDYELEIECSTSVDDGKKFFKAFLEKYNIERRPSQPKVARMLRKEPLYQFQNGGMIE